MKVILYKVTFAGIWDNKISNTIRNILKDNGFILKSDETNIGYEWHSYGYPDGYDYDSWYKNDGYKQFTYEDFPCWVPANNDSVATLLLIPEQYALLMFEVSTGTEPIKFESVSKSIIDVDHPMESLMKELSQVLTNGFSNAIVKQLIKQKENK